ncbi:MAG: hypothetical protein V4708_17530 [Bacteroidota bacterium]
MKPLSKSKNKKHSKLPPTPETKKTSIDPFKYGGMCGNYDADGLVTIDLGASQIKNDL